MKNKKAERFLCGWILAACLLIPTSRQIVFAQQEQEERAPGSETEPEKTEQPDRQRIVDIKKFPLNSPLPVRLLLGPFRWLAPRADRGMTAFENSKVPERLRILLSNPNIHPLIGSLGDGSGFGGGVYVSTADKLSHNFSLFASTHLTTKKYSETIAGFQIDPSGGEGRRFTLNFSTRLGLRPEESFFGTGPQSFKGERTDYNYQERGVSAIANFKLFRGIRAGFGVDYSSSRIFNGEDDRFADIGDVFGNRGLPGLSNGAALLGETAFIEYERRDYIGNPHAGAFVRFQATNNDSVGRDDFGFVNYLFDARGYIPLGTKRRTLALRVLGNFNTVKGNSEIPFFRLARLGTLNTLRGYDTYRFTGRNALASNIEYRYQLVGGIAAVMFTDIGQVYNHRSEFNTNNIHATFGGGVHIGSIKNVFLRVLYAKSGEGSRIYLGFGPSF